MRKEFNNVKIPKYLFNRNGADIDKMFTYGKFVFRRRGRKNKWATKTMKMIFFSIVSTSYISTSTCLIIIMSLTALQSVVFPKKN